MQKTIFIHGLFNSGKSLIYNLFDEEKYKTIDIDYYHFEEYKPFIKEQFNKKIKNLICSSILDKSILNLDTFFDIHKIITNQYKEYNFIFKPMIEINMLDDKRMYNENFYHLFIIRNPKVGWITNPNWIPLDEYISLFEPDLIGILKRYKDILHIIKIEEIVDNKIINQLIDDKRLLSKVKSYTEFDLFHLDKNIKSVYKDLKIIDEKLFEVMKFLGYDINDNKDLNELLEKINFKPYNI
jgi:hypothetical protein